MSAKLGMQPKPFDPKLRQAAKSSKNLLFCGAGLVIGEVENGSAVEAKLSALVVAATDEIGNAGGFLQKIDMACIVKVDDGAKAMCLPVFFGGGIVGSEHDLFAG